MRLQSSCRGPATSDELLTLLRACGLLDDQQAARLAAGWADGPAGPRLEQLVAAGLLTAYQAEQVAAGRTHRLRLGPYRLLDRLDARSAVYKAEHVLLRRTVVLKVLARARRRRKDVLSSNQPTPNDPLRTPRSSPRRTGRPRREVEACGRLDHPHIVAAHHATRLRGRLVLVFEYVAGADLARLVRETGPLPIGLAVEVARQAALALAYLHGRGLVHRDVKPANLMLAHEGAAARPVVKLLDLGLACPPGEDEGLCGTIDYVAPERGMGAGGCTVQADLYGLGCTLYFLLTGHVPFPGGSWTAKLIRHRLDEPAPVHSARPEVPPAVAELVGRLMARDPASRPESAAQVAAELAALRAPAPQPPRARPRGPSRALAVPLLGALVVGLVAGGLGRWGVGARRESAARSDRAAIVPRTTPWRIEQALATALDGETITVPAGTHVIAPVQVRGKRVTLRAGEGGRPVLRRIAGGPAWSALIEADRDLELIGLELQGDGSAPLVQVEGAALTLRDCRLAAPGPAPLAASRRGPCVTLERSVLDGGGQSVAVEVGGRAEVRISESELRVGPGGVTVLLWADELTRPSSTTVSLERSVLQGGRALACRGVGGPVDVAARGNRFACGEALVSLDGYGDREAWRRVVNWSGQGNRFQTGRAWLRVEGELQKPE